MNLIFIVFLLAVLLVLILLEVEAKVIFSFSSSDMRMNLTLLWLYPFLKAVLVNEDSVPMLKVHLFNKRVYIKALKAGKHRVNIRELNRMKLIRSIKLTDVNVQASYGFFDPLATGIACGIIAIITQFVNIDSLDQQPDFAANDEYVQVNAEAKLNIGLTLINLIRAYNIGSTKRLSYNTK